MKEPIMTTEQIEEYLAGEPSAAARVALTRFLVAELHKRRASAANEGRPKLPISDDERERRKREQNREAQARWREKQKGGQSKNGNARNPVL